MTVAIVKRCGCGRTYDAPAWLALPLCGYVGKRLAGGSWRYCELRHCACRSTLGVDVLWMPQGDDTPDDNFTAAAPAQLPSGEGDAASLRHWMPTHPDDVDEEDRQC